MLAAFLLCAWKDGLQTLLDTLFESLAGCPVRAATKSALSQARQKLKASAFVALNQRLLASLEAFWPEPRWRGLRLVAADGTTLRLPDLPENRAEFGVQAGPDGQPLVMARALGLYSVGAGRMLAATLAGYEAAERALLVELLPALEEGDLLSSAAASRRPGCSPCSCGAAATSSPASTAHSGRRCRPSPPRASSSRW